MMSKYPCKMANTRGRQKHSRRFRCTGGPYAGQLITLNQGGHTAPFTARGQSGFYLRGDWIPLQGDAQ